MDEAVNKDSEEAAATTTAERPPTIETRGTNGEEIQVDNNAAQEEEISADVETEDVEDSLDNEMTNRWT